MKLRDQLLCQLRHASTFLDRSFDFMTNVLNVRQLSNVRRRRVSDFRQHFVLEEGLELFDYGDFCYLVFEVVFRGRYEVFFEFFVDCRVAASGAGSSESLRLYNFPIGLKQPLGRTSDKTSLRIDIRSFLRRQKQKVSLMARIPQLQKNIKSLDGTRERQRLLSRQDNLVYFYLVLAFGRSVYGV